MLPLLFLRRHRKTDPYVAIERWISVAILNEDFSSGVLAATLYLADGYSLFVVLSVMMAGYLLLLHLNSVLNLISGLQLVIASCLGEILNFANERR